MVTVELVIILLFSYFLDSRPNPATIRGNKVRPFLFFIASDFGVLWAFCFSL